MARTHTGYKSTSSNGTKKQKYEEAEEVPHEEAVKEDEETVPSDPSGSEDSDDESDDESSDDDGPYEVDFVTDNEDWGNVLEKWEAIKDETKNAQLKQFAEEHRQLAELASLRKRSRVADIQVNGVSIKKDKEEKEQTSSGGNIVPTPAPAPAPQVQRPGPKQPPPFRTPKEAILKLTGDCGSFMLQLDCIKKNKEAVGLVNKLTNFNYLYGLAKKNRETRMWDMNPDGFLDEQFESYGIDPAELGAQAVIYLKTTLHAVVKIFNTKVLN
jgi:hypothetical protein